jgi:hypothetical protein
MRSRLLVIAALIAVAGGVFAATGSARTSTPGDGCFVVQSGFGKVTLTLTRGVVFGRYDEGFLLYNDRGTELNRPIVPGVVPTQSPTNEHLWKYDGTFVRFRATGPTRLTVDAQSINLSVAGRGWVSISGADWNGVPSTLNPPYNVFSVDASSFCQDTFQKMPPRPLKFQIASSLAR